MEADVCADWEQAATDPYNAAQEGLTESTDKLAGRFDGPIPKDKNDDYRPPEVPIDFGWIGEDAHGVWIARDPVAALVDTPKLWPAYVAYRAGQLELSRDDYRELTAVNYRAGAVLITAHRREERRRRLEPESEDGD